MLNLLFRIIPSCRERYKNKGRKSINARTIKILLHEIILGYVYFCVLKKLFF